MLSLLRFIVLLGCEEIDYADGCCFTQSAIGQHKKYR